LTPIINGSWQIKNCASFPSAPKGTSEALIYAMLKDIDQEWLGSPVALFFFTHLFYVRLNLSRAKPGEFVSRFSPSPSITSSSSRSSSSALSSTYTPFSREREIRSRASSETDESERSFSIKEQAFATDQFTSPRRITFGLSAAPKLEAVHNLKGWKVKAWLNTYSNIMGATGLLRRGEFRVRPRLLFGQCV